MADDMDVEMEIPRGTKRKAEDILQADKPRHIRALDQDVVNKIAAGEIIVAPVHALKELIENGVDAGSTAIEILVKEGGLKLLQITDNGHGINRDDLPILCERFTTSKLKAFEDLSTIGTYGFRGEALASISHIAHLTVTTKPKESSCAWRANYSGGKLVPAKPGQSADPKPTAGRQGTQITVEDLFYNVPARRRAFRSASEEYAKILDMVGRYAVHCHGVAFTCKKHGDTSMGISTPANATIVDRIRQIHGAAVANELIELKNEDDRLGFMAQGWVSNANYHVKRTMLLLFINHRAVESSAIKKAVEQTYSAFLPKGGHPFVYLSLDIDPRRVDVNVHPTKREVNFLNEDEIIEQICDKIRLSLSTVDSSRTFMTQTLLPGARIPTIATLPDSGIDSLVVGHNKRSGQQKVYENNLVRTDSRMRTITSMLPLSVTQPLSRQDSSDGALPEDLQYDQTDKETVLCRLTSVKELRAEVRDCMHSELTGVFAGHFFVGIVDERRRIAAIQGSVKLYLIDYGMISNEFFYQVGLTDFGNMGVIKFDPPLDLHELLVIAADYEQKRQSQEAGQKQAGEAIDWVKAVAKVEEQILKMREMLQEYFSLEISENGQLLSIPLLLKGYVPSMAKLPQFLLRLGPTVDWADEKNCFATFLRELASFYVPESLPPSPQQGHQDSSGKDSQSTSQKLRGASAAGAEDVSLGDVGPNDDTLSERPDAMDTDREGNGDEEQEEPPEITARRAQLNRMVQDVLFPAFKARLVATKGLLRGVVEVADLKGLYRVFERC
ncbi:putative DNA mismatch repair protein Mlh1 [Xylona heveae TC161]|uniref:Putative DNA mismatch repair protein Mlh1 n=1 Tax=Xylona heveae (strain CBS 132557 / TC161) TaxID=1328760 RepID=A0A165H8G4_XYLHT|nr:putative DNA mismatch repair protein Mlh1 [Xylona heveae TC161]KZF23131.1 putative DNA mismatch repair protein Mlh1 [Xylona heveae TC161]